MKLFTGMTLDNSRKGQGCRAIWQIAFAASVLINIVLFTCQGGGADKMKEGMYQEAMRETMIQQASISFGDVKEFVGYLSGSVGPFGEVCAVIPPFACSQCISRSLQELNELGLSADLMVPEGRFAETLPPVGPEVSVVYYTAPDTQNPLCFYPDLVFVVSRKGEVVDFYLHDKDVQEAMAVMYR